VDALFDEWAKDGTQLIAPTFFGVETHSILRQKVRRELTVEQADLAFTKLQALPVQETFMPGQRQRAWEITKDFGLTTVYDTTYLALAELRGCEYWTAEEKLFKQVKDKLTFVKWLGE